MNFFYMLFIINIDKLSFSNHIKLCKNCLHYKPYFVYLDYIPSLSRCKKFNYQDIITNETMSYRIDDCRDDENKCGKLGKYFESSS